LRRVQALDRLFMPASVAVIGASNDTKRGGGFLLKGLIRNNFKGKLHPVNPKESEIMGLKGYPSVLDIPGEVDLAVIAVSAGIVPQVIAECGQKDVKFAVIHSVGFSELGTEGKALENEVLRLAQQSGIRIVGPNCMGLYCPQVGLNTIAPLAESGNKTGAVALLGQSGWVTGNFIEMAYEQGLRFSKVVSIGNQGDLTIEDFLEYFGTDDQTKVIVCYIEGIKRGREFLQLLKRISQRKPIIVWKGGRSEAGVRAAASHTGSLAGDNVVFDAALTQSGVVLARNLDELIDLVVGFTCPVLPRGNKVGLLMEAGGGAVAGADVAEGLGLKIPTLSAKTQRELVNRLKDVIPPFSHPINPVDLVWAPIGNADSLYLDCAAIMLKDAIDAIVLVAYASLDDYFNAELVTLRDKMGKPILIIPGHPGEHRDGMSRLTRKGIPSFTIPERAAKALSAMVHYSNYLSES